MIERKFVAQNLKEFKIKEFVRENLGRAGLSSVKLQRTSLGDKIIIAAARPGVVVGRGGQIIQKLTKELKSEFKLENLQIDLEDVQDLYQDANVVAESIVDQLERFGSVRFKSIGHKIIQNIMATGALGVEITISGRIPSSRAKTWRFYQGYLKKCGDISIVGVRYAKSFAKLKIGIVGVQVRIMPSTTVLPDRIDLVSDKLIVEESVTEMSENEQKKLEEQAKETKKETKKESSEKDKVVKKTVKKTTKKKTSKKKEKSEE